MTNLENMSIKQLKSEILRMENQEHLTKIEERRLEELRKELKAAESSSWPDIDE